MISVSPKRNVKDNSGGKIRIDLDAHFSGNRNFLIYNFLDVITHCLGMTNNFKFDVHLLVIDTDIKLKLKMIFEAKIFT